MKNFALLFAVAIAGCAGGDKDDDDFPVAPSEPTGTHTPGTGTAMLQGRICVNDDIGSMGQCRDNNLEGFTVSIGDQTATTDVDGTFAVPMPRGSLLSFTVSGPGAITTTTPFSPSLTIPVIDADAWARTMASHQIFARDGTGAILGNVIRRDGTLPAGIFIDSTPTGSFQPLFDGEGSGFVPNATGARGVFWLNGITAGGTNLTMRDIASGGVSTVAGIQVVNGGVTILDSIVMP